MFCGYKHCATKELNFKKWNCLGHNIIFGGVGIVYKKTQDFSQMFVNCGKETAILYA